MTWFSGAFNHIRHAVGGVYNTGVSVFHNVQATSTHVAQSVKSYASAVGHAGQQVFSSTQQAIVRGSSAAYSGIREIANSGFVTGLENNLVANSNIPNLLNSVETPLISGVGGFAGGIGTVLLIGGAIVALKFVL